MLVRSFLVQNIFSIRNHLFRTLRFDLLLCTLGRIFVDFIIVGIIIGPAVPDLTNDSGMGVEGG